MPTIALSHLLERGVRLETHETVALVRELVAHPCGTPTLENIQLGSDGSVSCISTDGVLSVASASELLQTLLPPGTPNVPAPLRYTITRGLEVVEAPPFKSLDEFSVALARFEKGERRDVLRGVLQRVARPRPILVVDKPPASSSVLPHPTADAPPMFRSFSADGEALASSEHSPRRRALAAGAALVASFAMGFTVMDRIIDWRAATKSSPSAGMSAAAFAVSDSGANPRDVEVREEIVVRP